MKKCIRCGYAENNNQVRCSKCGGELLNENSAGRTCVHCGFYFTETGSFCPNCGKIIVEKKELICKKCGKAIAQGTLFCGGCGMPVETGVKEKNPTEERIAKPSETTKKRRKLNIILLIVNIILVISVAATATVIYFNSKSTADENKNTSETDKNERITDKESPENETEENDKKTSTYKIFKEDVSWAQANSEAIKSGGYLICINDESEFEAACKLADEQDLKIFWVGLSRKNETQSWFDMKWKDGSKITFEKWYEGEPTYYWEGNAELYLMVFKVGEEWYFNDATNDVTDYYKGGIGYIVEIEE